MNEMHSLGGQGNAHLNKSDVELYVINALAVARAAEVESHVACCDACAEALAREAQLEMALEMLAERTSLPAICELEGDVDAEVEGEDSVAPPAHHEGARTELTHAEIAHAKAAPVLDVLPASLRVTGRVIDGAAVHPANDVSSAAAPMTAPTKLLARRTRTGLAFAGALAAAAALVIWVMPGAKSEPSDDVAAYGSVSADAAGAMVSFEHNAKPNLDKLDGG